MKNGNNFTRLKDFLDSGTPKAKITLVTLCVLALVSTPFLVLIAASMGNAVRIFRQFETSKRFTKKQIEDSIRHLKHKKFIEYVKDENGKSIVKITKKGQTKLRSFDIELMKIKKPKKWDRKWILVMFDIPIRFTKGREALRYHLKSLGFFQFQKSAWIFPYPCEDEVIFIADFFGVSKYIEILTAERVLDEEKLKRHFNV